MYKQQYHIVPLLFVPKEVHAPAHGDSPFVGTAKLILYTTMPKELEILI